MQLPNLDSYHPHIAYRYFSERLRDYNEHRPFPRSVVFAGFKFTPEQMLGEVIARNWQLSDNTAPTQPQRDKPGQQASDLGAAALELLEACRAEGFVPREGEDPERFVHRAAPAPVNRAVPRPIGYATTHFGQMPVYESHDDQQRAEAHVRDAAKAAGFVPEKGAGPWYAAYSRFLAR